jgi:hypothetical protein
MRYQPFLATMNKYAYVSSHGAELFQESLYLRDVLKGCNTIEVLKMINNEVDVMGK